MGIESKITGKGQTTIPIEVREKLDLKPGDRVSYHVEDGRVVISKKRSIMELAGILHDPNRKPISVEEMDDVIQKSAIARYERSFDRD